MFLHQYCSVIYIVIGNLDNYIGILTDSQPGLPLWSSSPHINFTDTRGFKELSLDMTNISSFRSPLMSAFDVDKHLMLSSPKRCLLWTILRRYVVRLRTWQRKRRPSNLDSSYKNLALSIKSLPRSLANLPTLLASHVCCKGHNHINFRRTGCIHWSCECYARVHKAVMNKSPSLIDCLLALILHQMLSKDGPLGRYVSCRIKSSSLTPLS